MENIAVLIPCYNESKTVEKVVRDFRQALPEATIYVYDNNSTDHTDELARKAGAVVRYEYQQGKGNVVRRMWIWLLATDCLRHILRRIKDRSITSAIHLSEGRSTTCSRAMCVTL